MPNALSLLQFLAGIDAPEAFLLDETVEAIVEEAAPFAVAMFDLAEHAGFQPGADGRFGGRFGIEGYFLARLPWIDQRRAPARQHGMIHPALGTVGIADAPPGFEFGCDFNR